MSGYVQYYSNAVPVPQAMVHATGSTMVTSSPTDTSAHYVLTDLPTEDITVYADKTGDAGNAISALDAAFALQSALGLRLLSAEQRLACDVSGNGSLSAFDASLILRHAIGLITRFPVATACDSDWVFIPNVARTPSPVLIQPQPGADSCTPGALAYHPLTGSFDVQNFSALLFGDCTGNWQPPGGGVSARRAALASSPAVRAGKLRPLRSGRLALPIFVDPPEPVSSIELRVVYDPAAFRAVGARPVGKARGASVAVNARQAGVVRIALARGEAIDARSEPLLVVMFEAQSCGGVTAPSVSGRIGED